MAAFFFLKQRTVMKKILLSFISLVVACSLQAIDISSITSGVDVPAVIARIKDIGSGINWNGNSNEVAKEIVATLNQFVPLSLELNKFSNQKEVSDKLHNLVQKLSLMALAFMPGFSSMIYESYIKPPIFQSQDTRQLAALKLVDDNWRDIEGLLSELTAPLQNTISQLKEIQSSLATAKISDIIAKLNAMTIFTSNQKSLLEASLSRLIAKNRVAINSLVS